MQVLTRFYCFLLFTTLVWACGPKDPTEDTEFLKAVRQGKTKEVEQLLSQDPTLLNQKTKERGLTALHIASRKAQVETVELLLDKGAPINETSQDGSTALHYAFQNSVNAFAVSRILLEAGIDASIQNDKGQTAWAVVDQKSPKTWYSAKENELLGLLLKYDFLPDTRLGENQTTLLHRLSEKSDNPEIIRLLIEKHKLDPMARDAFGWTPLHYAAKGVHKEIAIVLLDNGAEINAQSTKNREELRSDDDSKVRYKYPVGSTPRDVYRQQSIRNRESLMKFFDEYRGKRSQDLE